MKGWSLKRKQSEKIADNAFSECFAERISVDEKNTYYDSRDNCNAIIETKTNRLIVGSESSTIPDGVEIIAKGVFDGHQGFYGFKTIRIPCTVVEIGNNAFGSCSELKTIEYNGTPEEYAKLRNPPKGVEVIYYSKDWKQL